MGNAKISAYDQAVRFLGIKMHSRLDLATKLKNKGFETDEIEGAIFQLEQEGFINDEKYAQIFLQNLIEYRSFGYYGIRNKLLLKKLPRDLVDDLLKQNLSEETELEIARRFLEKPLNKKRSRQSQAAALRQKGFRVPVIMRLL